ncbi:Hypothetical protein ETEE_2673 [Edwardsiella anguillarum ET080813]|uniref:Uncharacterized protein n=1 Tax=Edwardsiella anguillarum ET080813 TaxID=667120 RepID=A0A076LR11_9GAMM|nr:Hypothetical protein ETEE_2673 [Edwardsiella anguillarum ET080813]
MTFLAFHYQPQWQESKVMLLTRLTCSALALDALVLALHSLTEIV